MRAERFTFDGTDCGMIGYRLMFELAPVSKILVCGLAILMEL